MMADTAQQEVMQGEHIDIPSSVAAQVAMKNDNVVRALWANGGSAVVFLLALSIPTLPAILLVMLFQQKETGLGWLWITMAVICELIAFLVAFGMVRSVLESEQ